jgi:hypothetical protein
MLPAKACESLPTRNVHRACESLTGRCSLDVFLSLNVVRALSIIALLLVFSSSILVMVDDIEAVNVFVGGGSNSNSTSNHDYIE